MAEPAEGAAERLIASVGEPIERIITSPLRRALEVARAVAQRTGAPLHADDRLTDQDFGRWEGQAWAALPRAETAAWAADPVGTAPGGGESVADVLRRVRRAWTRIGSSEETTLVLTHALPIQCLLHLASGVPLETALARGIPFEGTVRFEGGYPERASARSGTRVSRAAQRSAPGQSAAAPVSSAGAIRRAALHEGGAAELAARSVADAAMIRGGAGVPERDREERAVQRHRDAVAGE